MSELEHVEANWSTHKVVPLRLELVQADPSGFELIRAGSELIEVGSSKFELVLKRLSELEPVEAR